MSADVIDITYLREKTAMLDRARAALRKIGFTAREIEEMERGSLISTNDPRVQRLVADALCYQEFNK